MHQPYRFRSTSSMCFEERQTRVHYGNHSYPVTTNAPIHLPVNASKKSRRQERGSTTGGQEELHAGGGAVQ